MMDMIAAREPGRDSRVIKENVLREVQCTELWLEL